MPKCNVVLMTRESATERAVADTLSGENGFVLRGTCRDAVALSNRLEPEQSGIVLVDVDPDPLPVLREISGVINRHPHCRFVALASDVSNEWVLTAMQVGFRYAQSKKDLRMDLTRVLHDLIPAERAAGGEAGKIFTVLSASGGCGATTLVVNMANELQKVGDRPVLLVDLDWNYGSVANYLDLKGQYGISEVLAHRGEIDWHLISSTAVRHSENLHALISPASVNFFEPASMDSRRLSLALQACREAYAFTLIDAPRVSTEIISALGHASDKIWIIMQPMVKDIRITQYMMSYLTGDQVPAEKITPVVNRCHRRHQMITIDEVRKALRTESIVCLRNDYTSAIRGINYGKPLSEVAPRSNLRRDVADLALQFADISTKR